jgi:DHA2 family multidrug resistance protein-like MFS transporter
MSTTEMNAAAKGTWTTPDGLPPAQRRRAILTYSIGLCMSVLDGNIANTALPHITKQLHATPASSIWVVNAFLLTVSVCVVPLSSLADIIGYKRVYQVGLAIFTVASLGCSLPHSLNALIAARILQGIGSACMWSVSAAVIRYTYPRALLGRGIGYGGIVVFTSAAAGPSIASGILALATWHWLFAINIPFGLLALSLSERSLAPAEGTRHRWDFVSAILSAVTVVALITGIDGLGSERPALVAVKLVVALAAGWLLVRRQIALPFPMLAIDLFRRPIFALASMASLFSFIGQGLGIVVLPFFLIDVLGFSQVKAGLLLTPWPLAAGIMSHLSGRLADRYSVRTLGTIGMGVFTAGLILLATAPVNPAVFDLVWRTALCGLGFGFFGSPNNRAMIAGAPKERSGGAGGISTMSRLLGQSLGVALVAVIFGIYARGGVTQLGSRLALCCGAVFTAAAGVISSLRQMGAPPE